MHNSSFYAVQFSRIGNSTKYPYVDVRGREGLIFFFFACARKFFYFAVETIPNRNENIPTILLPSVTDFSLLAFRRNPNVIVRLGSGAVLHLWITIRISILAIKDEYKCLPILYGRNIHPRNNF